MDWVQNSVFEGELTPSELKTLETKLKKMINPNSDSVQIYFFHSKQLVKKKTLGIPKATPTTVI
jgi:CRISPR-associated protein Cas2